MHCLFFDFSISISQSDFTPFFFLQRGPDVKIVIERSAMGKSIPIDSGKQIRRPAATAETKDIKWNILDSPYRCPMERFARKIWCMADSLAAV